MKTIRYVAERVHDFAWFADKRFFVLKDQAVLASGKTVDCWAMFTHSEADLWQKGAFYVRRAVEFYSKHVGEYPWPGACRALCAERRRRDGVPDDYRDRGCLSRPKASTK